MKNALDLGTYPREYCKGSLRPLVTEAVLGLIPKDDLNYELRQNLRMASIALDPLWRDCQAALSVGPLEFGRFEGERIRGAITWRVLFAEAVQMILNPGILKKIISQGTPDQQYGFSFILPVPFFN